jgi:hypothetical protein
VALSPGPAGEYCEIFEAKYVPGTKSRNINNSSTTTTPEKKKEKSCRKVHLPSLTHYSRAWATMEKGLPWGSGKGKREGRK